MLDQRRHQKIIEEAPSPLVERTPGMRAKLFDAARLAATAIGYTGAGTVEFMADDSGDFFFLEMNTRLQVEHPVTELTTGLTSSSCNCMSPTAAGSTRTAALARLLDRGRLYAEDRRGWQPQAGTVHRFDVPTTQPNSAAGRPGVRVDTGIVDGSTVSVFYDPMLAKVISYAPTRRQAAGTPRRRAGPHPATACAPTGTCWSTCCAPGLPRRRHRHRVLRHPRPG